MNTRILLMLLLMLSGSAATAQSITMQPVDHDRWQQQTEHYKGKILVVDIWATWCTPCLEQFPKLIELQNRYGDQGVQVIALNLDDRDDPQAVQVANAFLDKVEANFPNYHLDENLMQGFDKLGLMAIPVVLVYDAQGVERFRLTGDNPNQQFTSKDVERAIQQLIDEKP